MMYNNNHSVLNQVNEETQEDLAEHESIKNPASSQKERKLGRLEQQFAATSSSDHAPFQILPQANFKIQYQPQVSRGYNNNQIYSGSRLVKPPQYFKNIQPLAKNLKNKSPAKQFQNTGQLTLKKYSKRKLRSLSRREAEMYHYYNDYTQFGAGADIVRSNIRNSQRGQYTSKSQNCNDHMALFY
mmetsp:Transcript_3202/g.3119  ORF Transcript_3202/g.3119 Transcript_3202/m.3119 type:complete len:185 (-) Transcript_3202:103-657(-)